MVGLSLAIRLFDRAEGDDAVVIFHWFVLYWFGTWQS